MKAVTNIQPLTQSTSDNCVSTCLSMLYGIPLDELMETFHPHYLNQTLRVDQWFDLNDVEYRALSSKEAKDALWGELYLVTAPSLNLKATFHCLILDCRDVGRIELYDPNEGNTKGALSYVLTEDEVDDTHIKLNAFNLDFILY